MAQLLIPADLLQQDRSTSKLSEVAKRIAIPSDIVGTDWPEISGICRDELGIEFDAWQDGLGQLALAKNSAGILAHTVGGFHLSAMRQLGKTYWGSGTLFGMCKKYPGLLVIWTSHHGTTTEETFDALQGFCLRSRIAPHIRNVYTGSGDEAIEFVNGSRILFGARERGFGRGIPGVDVIFSDEAQILSDRAMNAMVATMNTSQIGLHIYAGTPPAPDELDKAAAWLRARDEAWVIEDKRVIQTFTEDLVWVEIGADDDADLDDVRQWFKNPSVPHRTPIHSVQRLRRKLKDDGFRREGLGIYGKTDGSIFDLDRWNALEADDPGPISRGALVVDVSPDGRWSSIALATELEPDDDPEASPRTLVIVFSMPGTKGVAAKVADLDAKRDLVDIAMTPGAARALETELTRLGVVYEIMPSNEVAASYVTMQKSIVDGSVAHLAQSELNFAMANSKSRYLQTGETQSFDRREYSVDTSPAVAAACAVYRWGLNNDPMPFIG